MEVDGDDFDVFPWLVCASRRLVFIVVLLRLAGFILFSKAEELFVAFVFPGCATYAFAFDEDSG